MAAQWSVLLANRPLLAKQSIFELNARTAAGIEVFLPECVVRVRKGAVTHRVRKPLLYKYMFARFDLADGFWKLLYSCRGVEEVMSANNRPIAVPDGQMTAIRQEAAKYDGIVLEQVPLTPGQAVQIIEGCFNTFPAKVTAVDPARSEVQVEVNIFGRATPTRMPWDSVAPTAA